MILDPQVTMAPPPSTQVTMTAPPPPPSTQVTMTAPPPPPSTQVTIETIEEFENVQVEVDLVENDGLFGSLAVDNDEQVQQLAGNAAQVPSVSDDPFFEFETQRGGLINFR